MANFLVLSNDEGVSSTTNISTEWTQLISESTFVWEGDAEIIGGPLWCQPEVTKVPGDFQECRDLWSSSPVSADGGSFTPSTGRKRKNSDEHLSLMKLTRLSLELGFEPVDVADQDDEDGLEVSTTPISVAYTDDDDYSLVDLSVPAWATSPHDDVIHHPELPLQVDVISSTTALEDLASCEQKCLSPDMCLADAAIDCIIAKWKAMDAQSSSETSDESCPVSPPLEDKFEMAESIMLSIVMH